MDEIEALGARRLDSCGVVGSSFFWRRVYNEDFTDGGFGGVGCSGGAAGGHRDAGEFHALEGGLDAAEAGAGHGYFVGGEDEAELLPSVGDREFGIDELVERQQEGAVRRRFDPDGAGVRVGGPAFGGFGAHGFLLVDGFCGGRWI